MTKVLKQAVVLLSGGLDSATVLYLAKAKGYKCHCLIFDYGQRHKKEILFAQKLARASGSAYQVLKIKLPWKGNALLDKKIKVSQKLKTGIPATYVPARNIIFLSFALSFAETLKAGAIFIGVHAQDYSGYPDCRPEFFDSFVRMAAKGTYWAKHIKILAPLIGKKKSQIIKIGQKYGVPFDLTWSCYQGKNLPCGLCDSCRYRGLGFKEAKIKDPLLKK